MNTQTLRKIDLRQIILEFTRDDDGKFFEFEAWGEDIPSESGRFTDRKLKEFYNKQGYDQRTMRAMPGHEEYIVHIPYESFIANAWDYEIEDFLKEYLITTLE